MRYLAEKVGKGGITAKVVAMSKNPSGDFVTTIEYEAPKCILAELNTHGLLAKNAQSSRAVPVKSVLDLIKTNCVTPVHWGKNQNGMVAEQENDAPVEILGNVLSKEEAWQSWAMVNSMYAQGFADAGYHKQIVNRPLEAFTMVKGVITANKWDNFFHLRYHPNADPYIYELAKCIYWAIEEVKSKGLFNDLKHGEWHTPYYGSGYEDSSSMGEISCLVEGALKTSAAACAQVSYRKLDTTEEKVENVWKRLMEDDIIHASVCEHQVQCIDNGIIPSKGVTAFSTELTNTFWSGKFEGWICHRHLIPNESFKGKFVPKDSEF